MSFFDQLRSGAEKAAFEADKVRRIASEQAAIRSLRADLEKAVQAIGNTTFSLYQEGKINHPELEQVLQQAAAVQNKIEEREQRIAAIRAEEFEATAGAQYGRICPNGHGAIPEQDNFCQHCGAQAIYVPPPAERQCPHCGASLVSEARFCSGCGNPVTESTEPAEEACPKCGAALESGAAFCIECGHRIEQKAEPSLAPAEAMTEEPSPTPEESETPDEEQVSAAEADPELPETIIEQAPGEEVAAPDEEVARPVGDEAIIGEPPSFGPGADEGAAEESILDMSPMATTEETIIEETPQSQSETDSTCPVCGTAVLDDATFCVECGQPLTVDETGSSEEDDVKQPAWAEESSAATTEAPATVCPSCNAPVLEDAAFCVGCGHRI